MKRNGLTAVVFSETPPDTDYREGHWSWVSDSTADDWIKEGYCEEWKPEPKPKPTMDNTKKEIEQYLDDQGIEYDEFATKSDLLELING